MAGWDRGGCFSLLHGVLGMPSLSENQLFDGSSRNLPRAINVPRDVGHRLARATPLWYYILREAEVLRNGEQLGPLGSTIVAEVILGILFEDKTSYVNVSPGWQPVTGLRAPRAGPLYKMQDLIAVATGKRGFRLSEG
jgi:hypothetical protein